MFKTLKESRGFTLIELMVVIVILSLLAVLVGPKIIGRTDDAKIAAAKDQIRNIETGLKLYKLDNGNFPSTEQGLQALVTKPTVGKIPTKYKDDGYLENKNVPKDPWGNDYLYVFPGQHGAYDIVSYGADGKEGGDGADKDIVSWDQ